MRLKEQCCLCGLQKPVVQGDVDGAWQHDLFKTDKLDYGGEGDTQPERGAARRAGPRSHVNEARSTRLRITNLHYEVSERELEVRRDSRIRAGRLQTASEG